jgi:hypothetical protein
MPSVREKRVSPTIRLKGRGSEADDSEDLRDVAALP